MPSERLGPSAAAAGLAKINAVDNLAGFPETYLIGVIREEADSFALAFTLVMIIGILLLASNRRAMTARHA